LVGSTRGASHHFGGRRYGRKVDPEKGFELCRQRFFKLAKPFVLSGFRRDLDDFIPFPESTPVPPGPPEPTQVLEKLEKPERGAEVECLLGGDGGLRRGEMMGLRWTDVDFRRAQLRIEQAAWKRSRRDPIDAHIVLLARERGWPVISSDPETCRRSTPG
jgi:integrase